MLETVIYALKYFIPNFYCILFHTFGLGYKTKKRAIIGLMGYTIYLMGFLCFSISHLGYRQTIPFLYFIMLSAEIFRFIISSDPPLQTLYMLCVQNNILTPTHLFCNAIREGFSLSYITVLWIEIFVCSIIYFLGTKYWVKPFRKLLKLSKEGQAFITFTSASVSTLVVIITTYFGVYFGDNPFFYLAVSIFLEGIYFLCLIKFYKNTLRIQELTRKNEKTAMLELSVKMTKERLSLLEESAELMKIEKHDRRHINTMLLQMLKGGQIEKVIQYLTHSLKANNTITKNYCENITVNALISYYAEVCQKNGIKFMTSLDIPEKCVKDDMELSMALSNLLENAVNAAKKVNDKKRFIQISALYTGQLLIEIKNSSLSDVLFNSDGYPISLRENHGTGTKSVLTYVEKMNGEISYQLKENIFYVRINL